ncbi:MAG: HAD-superfamily hydrolase, subfamily variant 1 [Paenibacillaceae bacterium]|jgi:putative hydrolase of the HAD superfamily|nr:HAD-superfamily hydrolase, subfamily variant 1 [Paenibacillaceae bacterium]
MKPKVIIFDLDETLTDRSLAIEEFANRFVSHYFPNCYEDEARFIKNTCIIADNGGYRDKQEVYHMLVVQLNWTTPPGVNEYVSFFREEMPKCIKPKKYLYESLSYFLENKVRMGIITNGTVKMQRAKIDVLGIQDYFECIVISEEAGIRKPEIGIYRIALEQLRILPSEVWFVGDNPTNDIMGAMDFGMKGIWITRADKWEIEEYKPYAMIRELNELVELYKAL